MKTHRPEIVALRAKVNAAREEFDLALRFHEAWKPAAYDEALHVRLGVSRASNTFQVLRLALRREMLMALMRLWDERKDSVGMGSVANSLDDRRVLDALAAECAAQWGGPLRIYNSEDLTPDMVEAIRQSEVEFGKGQANNLRQHAANAKTIIRTYEKGGTRYSTFLRLRALRHQRLAHRQVKGSPVQPGGPDDLDAEIQAFYEEMARLIRLLFLAVNNTDYDPEDAARIHARHAALFWAGVKGERTEGHPSYVPYPV